MAKILFRNLQKFLPRCSHCPRHLAVAPKRYDIARKVLDSTLIESATSKYSAFVENNPEMLGHRDFLKSQLTLSKLSDIKSEISETKDIEKFREVLLNCTSAEEVLQHLEISDDDQLITGGTAIRGLKSIYHLVENTCGKDIEAFVKADVLQQLLSVAHTDIHGLTMEELVNLVKFSLMTGMYNSSELNAEVLQRLTATSPPTVVDVCSAITVYSNPLTNIEVWNSLWDHLQKRLEKDVDETNIMKVLKSVWTIGSNENHRQLLEKLASLLERHIYKISHDDIAHVCVMITVLNFKSPQVLRSISLWMFQTMDRISNQNLLYILTPFIYFKHCSKWVLKRLQRDYFHDTGVLSSDRALSVMVFEYFSVSRYCLTTVVDSIVQDYVKNSKEYSDREFLKVIGFLGHCNYLPKNANQVFEMVEDELSHRIAEMDVMSTLHLLCSFAYLNRLPENHIRRINSLPFMLKMKRIPDMNKRVEACRKYKLLLATSLINANNHVLSSNAEWAKIFGIYKESFHLNHFSAMGNLHHKGRKKNYHYTVHDWLRSFNLTEDISINLLEPKTHYEIDFVVPVPYERCLVKMKPFTSLDTFDKVAVLIVSKQQYYHHEGHTNPAKRVEVGELAMKQRLLKELCYGVVVLEENVDSKQYLKEQLGRYMNLNMETLSAS